MTMYVKYPLSLRNVEDLLSERGIDICYETVRLWWNRFGPIDLSAPTGPSWRAGWERPNVRPWKSAEPMSAFHP